MTTIICLGDHFAPGCGKILTDEEAEFYGTACEACARESAERLANWREGGEDEELDEIFSARPTCKDS